MTPLTVRGTAVVGARRLSAVLMVAAIGLIPAPSAWAEDDPAPPAPPSFPEAPPAVAPAPAAAPPPAPAAAPPTTQAAPKPTVKAATRTRSVARPAAPPPPSPSAAQPPTPVVVAPEAPVQPTAEPIAGFVSPRHIEASGPPGPIRTGAAGVAVAALVGLAVVLSRRLPRHGSWPLRRRVPAGAG